RNIHYRANHLNELSARTQNRMADPVNMLDCSIGFHRSELNVAMHFLEKGPITRHPELVPVFRVYSLHPLVPLGYALMWIETEKSEHFLGPVKDLVTSAI